jgi:putative nucleotidyltransferase with HDIG domain
MRSIQGSLSLMSVPDILQWAEQNKRTGTLSFRREGNEKKIYFQDGMILLVSSDKEGERLAEFLHGAGINVDVIKEAFKTAEVLGIPFVGYLLSQEVVNQAKLEEILNCIAERAIRDTLKWETGTFEFVDVVPPTVLNGPLQLRTSWLIMEAVRVFDEGRDQLGMDSAAVVAEIKRKIQQGAVEIPPMPDLMVRLVEQIQQEDISIVEIVNSINDQILASKILKVSNSPFFGHKGKITSLQDAFIYMGLKSVLSIITVHSLSGFNPKNAEQVRKILHHCLVCAFLAKQISLELRANLTEQAFVCALLHDIGKTLLLNLLEDYQLAVDVKRQLVDGQHQHVGYLLAENWNFPNDVKEVVRYHHAPAEANDHRQLVEIVHLADLVANRLPLPNDVNSVCANLDFTLLNLETLVASLAGIEQTAQEIIFG